MINKNMIGVTTLLVIITTLVALLTTVHVVQAALPTIEEQLRNAREATAAGKYEHECQVRCYPGQDANFTAEMEKHGYDSSDSADVSEFFLSDRGKELSAYYDRLEAAANPYCDLVSYEYMQNGGECHDRKDASDTTGLFTCNDGTHKTDWRDCKDATAPQQ